jgi:hypothetical protein
MKMETAQPKFVYDGNLNVIDDLGILIGCSKGVWQLYGPRHELHRMTSPTSVYGITRDASGAYWAACRDVSKIFTFDLAGTKVVNLKCMFHLQEMNMGGSKKGLHQIDIIGGELYIMDTYNNRCVVCGVEDAPSSVIYIVYPVGYAKQHYPKNPKHRHFNSVYGHGDNLYLLAHNNTLKSGKFSDIYVYGKDVRSHYKIIEGIGRAAHNIIIDEAGSLYTCDSGEHSLLRYDGDFVTTLFRDSHFKTFTRGLAMNQDIVVIGGSRRGNNNKEQNGYLFFLDRKDYSLLCTVTLIKCGQIHEVRLTGYDLGYSDMERI